MKRLLFLHITLLFCSLIWAQAPIATDFPYSCSFEESENLSVWSLNVQTEGQALDEWMYGDGAHSEGKRSMYISSNKKSPRYGNKPNIVVSYLRYQFPKAGTYDISFDWKCVGDAENARMYMMICPEYMLSDPSSDYYLGRIVSSTSGIISPNFVQRYCQQFGGTTDRFLCGSEQWLNTDLTNPFRVSSTTAQLPFAIVFIWVNENRDETVDKLSICIDNLEIGTGRIKKPMNVQVEPVCEDSSLVVSWESGLNEFEVQYRKVGSNTWRRQDGIMNGVEGFTRVNGSQCSYILQRIKEGTYDVRVRGITYDENGDTIRSNFAYKNLALVYCPENHCVNYIDLYGPNVTCTYGMNPAYKAAETPYDYTGVLDYGPDSEESRHTLHVDPYETDPRTDGELMTVPKGALASVRLGNWKTSGQAESITYEFVVDSANQGVLIIQYAVVLENPGSSHSHAEEPRFNLEVLDEHDNLIDESCGRAEFYYSDGVEAGWNVTKDDKVVWKDWTTIGVNLMPYNGQTIRVRFTTYDCGQGGHYGYAYFILDCASAHLETENCGNDSKIECYAPEGFAYAWYKGDPDEPGNQPFWFDRELVTDPGRQEYTCRVSFIEDPECYFDVSTISEPRFPVAEFSFDRLYGVYGDGREDPCTSRLKFHNTSHVMTKYDGKETHTREVTNDAHWYFRRLSNNQVTESYNWNPVYSCPAEGDSIEVMLWTYIGVEESPCDTVRIDTIVVPNIIPDSTEFHYTTCPETPIYFGGQWFNTDTTFIGAYPNFAGCDSLSTLHLKVWPEVKDTYRHDSICSDGSVTINGVKYNQPMENFFIRLKTVHDCDSGLYFTLTVNERIQAEVAQVPDACADDEVFYLTYDISAGKYDSLVITFSTPQLRDTVIYDPDVNVIGIPYPADITPGHYAAKLVFHQFCCGTHTEERSIDVRYRNSIVEQKWNDVLTLLAPKYNGGFEFTSFQWYKNDTPIEGATHSYLYQDLDFDADYYVVVTRKDGVSIATCPIRPVYHPQQSEYPTIIKVGQRIPIYMEQPATIWYYTISGQLYGSYSLPQGYTTLEAPTQTGVYVLKSVNAQGETKAQKIIVE